LENLLRTIRQHDPVKEWKIALEFRSVSWYHDEIYDLLRFNNTSLVLHDLPSSATPLHDLTADFVYVRFHGTEKGYRGSYPDDFLSEYATRINTWKNEGKEVYVYFNNTLGDAARNLMTLNQLIHQAS
jgi:uncharacterized protein YecE (DUF72 family)